MVAPLFSGKVHLRVDIQNTAVSANTDMFAANVFPRYGPISFFMIYVCFDGPGILAIRRTFLDTGVTVSELMNEGNTLVSNAAYVFAFPVSDSESINVQIDYNGTVRKLTLLESEVK